MKRTRVCMLVTSDLDRDPRVKKEAESAVDAGYDVVVICRSYSGPPRDFQISALNTKRASSRIRKYLERLWTNLSMISRAIQLRPDIVHANDLDTLPAGYLISRLTGAKLLYDAHEFWADAGRDVGAGKRLIPIIERLLVKRCDAVVAASKYRAQLMSQKYHIPLPTTVMNTPVQTGHILSAQDNPNDCRVRSDKTIRVLHLGVYAENRGLENAVVCTKYLPPQFHLTFIGYGAAEDKLRSLARHEGLEKRVTFLPPVSTEEVVSTASSYDIGLVLYRPVNLNNLYAAPNKLFEYMMAGLAVAGSDLPLIREIIDDSQVGVTFDPDDPHDMAQKIRGIAADPVHMHKMKKKALLASQRYTWQSESLKLMNLYAELAQS